MQNPDNFREAIEFEFQTLNVKILSIEIRSDKREKEPEGLRS